MVGFVGDYNVIDVNPGDFYEARVQVAVFDNLFNLNDDDTAAVMNCLGYGRIFQRSYFFFHRNIAAFVGICTAQEGDVDWECRVEKLFLSFDFQQFYNVFLCNVIELAAALTRIEESTETNIGKHTDFMASQGSEPMN